MTKKSKQPSNPGRIVRTAENLFHNPERHEQIMDEWINPVVYAKRTQTSGKHPRTAKEMQLDMLTQKKDATQPKKKQSRLKRAATRLKSGVGTVGRGIDAMWSDPEQHDATMAVWGAPAAGARRTPPPDAPTPQATTVGPTGVLPPAVVINIQQAAADVPVPEVGAAARPPTSPTAKRTEPTLDDILQSPENW